MGLLRDFLDRIFGTDNTVSLNATASALSTDDLYSDLWSYRLALSAAAERIGGILSKCEFKTYINGKEVQGDNYYLLNVEPNPNQTAAEFRKQLIRQLIMSPKHEALIVILDNVGDMKQAMFVADSFSRDEYQILPTYFTNVSIDVYQDVPLLLDGTFGGSRCVYLKYTNNQLESIFAEMKDMLLSLMENSQLAGTYRQKYILSMDQTAQNSENFEDYLQQILNESFDAFMKGDNAVLPLYAGMKIDQVSAGSDLGQNASVANRNVNFEADEAFQKVGIAFSIPTSLMNGSFEADDLDHTLTFCIDPIAEMITQALNRKWYGKKSYMGGTFCKLSTKKARHYDIVSLASSINQAVSSGVYTINEVRDEVGMSPIDPKIGDVHWITTNYAVAGAYVQNSEAAAAQGANIAQQTAIQTKTAQKGADE